MFSETAEGQDLDETDLFIKNIPTTSYSRWKSAIENSAFSFGLGFSQFQYNDSTNQRTGIPKTTTQGLSRTVACLAPVLISPRDISDKGLVCIYVLILTCVPRGSCERGCAELLAGPVGLPAGASGNANFNSEPGKTI